jgi:putative DNA-invertase from lambdoid prophage Rac
MPCTARRSLLAGRHSNCRRTSSVKTRTRKVTNQMPSAFAYIRVSHPEQVESGLSLEAQEQDCQKYWARLLQPRQIAWAKLIADEAVSAFKHPLAKRRGGRELLASVRRGDHVIMTRFDRAFRSMRDFLNTYSAFENLGVTLHLMDAPWDYGTANGRAMLQLMAVFAEWSSRIASERIKAAQAILRQQGRPTGGRRPFGYRVVGENGQRLLQPDWTERAILLEIVRAVEIQGIAAWDKLSRIAQRAADRVYPISPDSPRRNWTENTVRRAVDGFWRVARTDGVDWIRDPTLKGLAMVRLAQASSHERRRPSA